jgi:hypothetical protein
VSESSTGADSVSSTLAITGQVNESATGADQVSSSASFKGVINETASGTATPSALGAFNASVQESSQATDSVSSAATVLASVQENVQAVDTLIARLLWEIINDYEVSDWSVITTSAAATTARDRVATFGGFGFAELAFAGTERGDPTGWTPINTYESDDWAVIPTKE